jgi:hypothetical protein
MSKKIITQEVTLSFPHLDEPTVPANGKGEPKYSASLLYPAGADMSAEQAAVIEVATEKFGANALQMMKQGKLVTPFRTDWESKGYPEGTIFINVRSTSQPGLVYPHKDPKTGKPALIEQDKIKEVLYAGAKVRASIVAFAYEYREGNAVMKKGISFGLNNLQKLEDGPRLDGRKAADDEFEATQELAPADLSDLEA